MTIYCVIIKELDTKIYPSMVLSPKHWRLPGSGSHSPFLVHIDVLGPLSSSPAGQANTTMLSSTAGSMKSSTLT